MRRGLLLFSLLTFSVSLHSVEFDEELAQSLKIEANHNIQRLRSFRTEVKNNIIFDEEREKGLGEFLEDQEKWDLVRDRGLEEYRRQKRANTTPQEGGPEYLEYLEEKESQEARYERSRLIHAVTVESVKTNVSGEIEQLEKEELGLINQRPRYDLRRRSQNKWVSSGSSTGGRSSFNSGNNVSAPSFDSVPPANDFVPPPEFPPAPPAFDATDDGQFSPPPVFDPNTGMPLDGGFPAPDINIPPPPPPTEFDF